MSELKKVITLHSIRVTSITNPHNDLPGDMKMFAQLIMEDNIFGQTLPVESENNRMSWKLWFGYSMQPHVLTFSVTILRQSETEGKRLLGYIKLRRDEILGSVNSPHRLEGIAEDYNVAFQLELNKVNPDGPTLKFSARFSVSSFPDPELSGLDLIGMLKNTVVLESAVALTPDGHISKALRLNNLGSALLSRFQQLGDVHDLNQCILKFGAAVALTLDGHQHKPAFLNNLGNALHSRFEQLGDLNDLNQSIWKCQAAMALTPDGHSSKMSQLNNLGNSLLSRFEQLGDPHDLNESIVRYEAAVALTPDGHPSKPLRLNNLGGLGDLNDLNQAIVSKEAAVALTPDGDVSKPSWLNNLGNSLHSRFEQFGDLNDLNQSILRFQAAVTLTLDGHPEKPTFLNNLGNTLHSRFEQLGDLEDLNQSIWKCQAAMTLTPDDHPHKASQLNSLGNSLLSRFERLGDLHDLNQCILRFQAAVALTPDGHPSKPLLLSNLGGSFLSRFKRIGDLDDLNQAVLSTEAAIALTPDGHVLKPSQLNNLGNSLLSRFERFGDLNDLNQSVLRFHAGLSLIPDGHSDKPSLVNNLGRALHSRFEQLGALDDLTHHRDKASQLNALGDSLLCRFERLGDLHDLSQSILRFQAAVALTPDGHPSKPSWLNNLGNSLLSRFKQVGDLDDLTKSVLYKEAAVTLIPDGHPSKPVYLNNLAASLLSHFERVGSLENLNQSILRLEAAVALTPDGHPSKPSWLSNLGKSLYCRYGLLGDLDDLYQSVFRSEAAVALTPDDHPSKPLLLSNLCQSLHGRFDRLGDLDDLYQYVFRSEAAVALTPDGHPHKAAWLHNLGGSLFSRFEQLGDLDDLNQSILRLEAAVALTPDGHADKPLSLHRLGKSLHHRFEWVRDLDDLNQSILSSKAAVALTPDGHPMKPSYLNNLANSLLTRFNQLHDPEDAQQLLSHFSSAACSETGSAQTRFSAAKMWATCAQVLQHSSLLRAYTVAIELLPELAWLGLSMTDRHYHLSQAGQVVRDAASAAIAAHDYQKAVEWLDQGRSIIWGQVLSLRTSVDELKKSHPDLANQFVSLSWLLEGTGTRSNNVHDGSKPQSLQSIADQSHAFALERNHVIQQIKALPGFEGFLLPKPFSELSLAAKERPCLADQVTYVPLHDFTIHEAQAMAKSLASIVGTSGRSDRFHVSYEGEIAPHETFSYILSELWFKIVNPVLNAIKITTPVSQPLQRIWWCPTGPLAFLPIHAAGLYGEDQAIGSKLSDFLISSYTTSLAALIQGFQPQSESQADLTLLAVTQPSANGQPYLPGTQKEVKCIQQHAMGKIPVLWLDEDKATIENVQKGMKQARWVHFACHGVQSTSPTESALLLAGSSRLTLSNIIELSIPNADLAFLSACQTATGSNKLQDEAVHLTAGMLLAGYRGVIGTMWSIGDNDAPQVAADVYAHLLEKSSPDPTRAAEALHLAIRNLQEQLGAKNSFLRWVPFIHFGV
ncbi:hypothetical protein MSAN_00499700 [Mycena sanguinolenta]|uniref:CHAT domain-containing protein n=1 Tax=Mycena sanguinolenta TaxID=230812 RepID=A0A8H6Z5G8_9AGAR|nr:hypothetical protein MSAN_00499700 [Mycena sanguinolenta]